MKGCHSMKRIAVLILASFAVLSLIVFVIKYNDKKDNEKPPFDNEINAGEVFKTEIADEEGYLLIAEKEYLNLYKIGEKKTLKKSERINTALFPEEDITNLIKGIEYNSSDDAFAAMENFVG